MRLATRMKITYIIVFFVPIILLILTFFCLGSIELKELEERYGMQNASVNMLFDPFEMLEEMSGELNDQLKQTIENEPEKMADFSYLESMDQQLQKTTATLVVLKNYEVYYSGMNDLTTPVYEKSNGSLCEIGDKPYCLKQWTFLFEDGARGVAQVLTPVDEVMEQVRSTVAKICVSALI